MLLLLLLLFRKYKHFPLLTPAMQNVFSLVPVSLPFLLRLALGWPPFDNAVGRGSKVLRRRCRDDGAHGRRPGEHKYTRFSTFLFCSNPPDFPFRHLTTASPEPLRKRGRRIRTSSSSRSSTRQWRSQVISHILKKKENKIILFSLPSFQPATPSSPLTW